MSSLAERVRSLLGRFGSRSDSAAAASGEASDAAPIGLDAAPLARSGPPAELVHVLRRRVAEISDRGVAFDDIDPTVSILDYGYVDSVSSVRLLGFIEERYGVDVPETELVGRANSIEGLAEYIEREAAQ